MTYHEKHKLLPKEEQLLEQYRVRKDHILYVDNVIKGLVDTIDKCIEHEEYEKKGIKVLKKDDIKSLFEKKSQKKEDEAMKLNEVDTSNMDKKFENIEYRGEIAKRLDALRRETEIKDGSPTFELHEKYCKAGKCKCEHVDIYSFMDNSKVCTVSGYSTGTTQRIDSWERCPVPSKIKFDINPYEKAYYEFHGKILNLGDRTSDNRAKEVFEEVVKNMFNPK